MGVQKQTMSHIHWYPGHIAKAEKTLSEKLNLIDVVVEVLDARIPISSSYPNIKKLIKHKPRLILLNKTDLADAGTLKLWKEFLERENSCPVLFTSANSKKDENAIVTSVLELSSEMRERLKAKNILERPARIMVIGMPNVGKSTIINRLTKNGKAKVGAKAGVTRQQQWVRVHDKIELLDTPGIIPTVQDNQLASIKLATVSSIGENAFDNEFVACELLKILQARYEARLRAYYGVEGEITIENIALARNWIVKGAQPDIVRTSQFILTNFRNGKIGKFTLDELPV